MANEHEKFGDTRWVIGAPGLVVDTNDPEGMHRIKAIISPISESHVHDEWISAMVPWVGPDGYGPVHLPKIGAEVLIFGRYGQKYSLFYLCVYNEDHRVPAGFSDARGMKVDTIYRLLCDLLIEVISQTQVLVRGEERADVQGGQAVDVDAPDVRLVSGGGVSVHGQGAKVGFLGAAPVARQTLPGPASDPPSCIALANAIRAALITNGQCQ
jgi:hypothetical protein